MTSPQEHIVQAVSATQYVTVEIDGRVVAETRHPVLVYETGLPVRYYIPPQDVSLELLRPTDTHTVCPYKGEASYWSYGEHTDVAWAYPEPIDSIPQIKDHLSFYDTVATITASQGPSNGQN
ncbi:DUF427 domain-containing protein [Streptomyces sp. NPDC052309]|uniref:DUF427 domain-containing protein n=1 Tax=Streptomyces sp. NPDC052309 TaxID=3155421 RepID=UPI003445C017